MSETITGTIHHIGELQQVNSTFSKREVVISIQNGEYSNGVVLEAVNDKCSVLDQFNVGEEVEAGFFWSGRLTPYNGRYYNSINLGFIKHVGEQQPAPQNITPHVSTQCMGAAPIVKADVPSMDDSGEQIPF